MKVVPLGHRIPPAKLVQKNAARTMAKLRQRPRRHRRCR